MDPKSSRGYANNNPGNIDRSEPPWVGEIRDPSDPRIMSGAPADFVPSVQRAIDIRAFELEHGRFTVMDTAIDGFRELAKNLQAYRDRLGLRTIRTVINRHAPPNENNTAAYIDRVCLETGLGPDDDIGDEQWRGGVRRAIMGAITDVECGGNPYQGTELADGDAAAGYP